MNVELTKSQIRKIVMTELINRIPNEPNEINFALKYVLSKEFRVGNASYCDWEIKKK